MLEGNIITPAFSQLRENRQVVFLRDELSLILNIYGRMVAAGEWRDYGIQNGKDCAVFSIFRRASEMPVYRITKTPDLANRQGAFALLSMDNRILKRGHHLHQVLSFFEKRLMKLVE